VKTSYHPHNNFPSSCGCSLKCFTIWSAYGSEDEYLSTLWSTVRCLSGYKYLVVEAMSYSCWFSPQNPPRTLCDHWPNQLLSIQTPSWKKEGLLTRWLELWESSYIHPKLHLCSLYYYFPPCDYLGLFSSILSMIGQQTFEVRILALFIHKSLFLFLSILIA
jgi:hypothetical protein